MKRSTLAVLLVTIGAASALLRSHTQAQGQLTAVPICQSDPRTPIRTLPYTINVPGSYYLARDLVASNFPGPIANGIVVSANNVPIDLNGFRLEGSGASGSAIAVSDNYENLRVFNGMIADWPANGVAAATGARCAIDHVHAAHNGTAGIAVGPGSRIEDCAVKSSAIGYVVPFSSTIHHCTSESCADGFDVGYMCILTDCIVDGGTTGIRVDGYGVIVRDCTIRDVDEGILLPSTSYSLVTNNTVTVAHVNGIHVKTASHHNRIEANHVSVAAMRGIWVEAATQPNVVVRNTSGSSGTAYVVDPSNDLGPIGTAATSTSPWSNIAH